MLVQTDRRTLAPLVLLSEPKKYENFERGAVKHFTFVYADPRQTVLRQGLVPGDKSNRNILISSDAGK